jgi:hypothetical protein
VRQPHLLEYYAQSEWVDTPARMLAPLIVSAIENTGAFRAVILTPSAATGELRLHTEIIRLQHDLSAQPGRVVFTLRAYLVDTTTRGCWRRVSSMRSLQPRLRIPTAASFRPIGRASQSLTARPVPKSQALSFSGAISRNSASSSLSRISPRRGHGRQ